MSNRPLNVTLGALGGDPREGMVRLSRMGGDGIGGVQLSAAQEGLRPRDLDRMARRGLRERLSQLELRVSGIDLWIPPGHYSDPRHADRAAEAIRDAIGLAADLGRVGVSISLPPARDPEPARDTGEINARSPLAGRGIVTAESFAVFVAGGESASDASATGGATRGARSDVTAILGTMLEEADRHGVDLIDHAAPPRLGDLAGHPRCRVGIDPAAWLARGGDPYMAVAEHAQRVALARLCDLTVGGLRAPIADEFAELGRAERQLDVTAFAGALSVIDDAVPLVIDTRQWPDPWSGVVQTAAVWRRAVV